MAADRLDDDRLAEPQSASKFIALRIVGPAVVGCTGEASHANPPACGIVRPHYVVLAMSEAGRNFLSYLKVYAELGSRASPFAPKQELL